MLTKTTFQVNDMSCDHCVKTIRQAFEKALPDSEVTIDLATKQVTLSGAIDAQQAAAVIRAAGYEPS